MVSTYDASWLVPGKLMVAADPITTVHDPNPDTFQLLWSTEDMNDDAPDDIDRLAAPDDIHRIALLNRSVVRPFRRPFRHDDKSRQMKYLNTLGGDCYCPDDNDDANTDSTETPQCLMQRLMPPTPQTSIGSDATKDAIRKVVDLDDGASSVETVCKEYHYPVTTNGEQQQVKSFSDFLQESEIQLMIRCNFQHEQGMPTQTYSADKLKKYGVDHRDIQFVDKDGGLPARRHVAAMIRAGAPVIEADAGAVLVHCKGGFGRSVVLACCLMIHTYDVSGRALLGWMRIARPGAITTPQQEEFLMSLKGQADVDRFAGIYQEANDEDAARTACRVGCTVQ
jgi:protein tyrosine phosphatase (PTP) superfamily phosphohydrolase (DUF442 family)